MTKSIFKKVVRTLMTGAVVLGVMQASMSYAATDGALGATSEGKVNITLTTNPLVKITGLDDINMVFDGTSTDILTSEVQFCVFTNKADPKYIMDVESENQSFQLTAANGNTDTVDYNVYVANSSVSNHNGANTIWGPEQGNEPASGLEGGNEEDLLVCGDGAENTKMWVVTNELQAKTVQPDSYTDTLTLTVSAS
ncbi:hypothetical protein [Endozoicomonas sp.]|uniref:hypothetical protein n=1 Tax=Endozoicomonas sp. TaxID=1892382 RepID=UPI002888A8F2|nr:hypothetical protein [Endozoicomonas sp.]